MKILKALLAIVIGVIALTVAFAFTNKNKAVAPEQVVLVTQPTDTSVPVTTAQMYTFEGTISAYDTSCFSDGVCSVTVGGKKVILVTGGRAMAGNTVGKLIGVGSISDLGNKIGATADVYALPLDNGDYTLYGDAGYYVKVL